MERKRQQHNYLHDSKTQRPTPAVDVEPIKIQPLTTTISSQIPDGHLPQHSTAETLRQRNVLRVQRSHGNAFVQQAVARNRQQAVSINRLAALTEHQLVDVPPRSYSRSAVKVSDLSRVPEMSSHGGQLVQRLEAAHHEHIERGALTVPGGRGGFTDAEASATYVGNWTRDFSQAFLNNPVTAALGNETIFEILNVLAMQKFGHQLTPRDFGVYSPREHIDNPIGQINADLLRGEERRVEQASEDEQIASPEEDISSPQAVAQLFVVNEAGLPAYLGRSIQYSEEEFSEAADLGRNRDGLRHFGNGLHTVEDLFAHSNYIEIAVGRLIQDGEITLSPNLQQELDERSAPTSGGGAGLDPIETMSGRTTGGRPILTTGTFVTADTMISIAEAISAFLADFDPFSVSNEARSRQTMELILTRYETLARSNQASTVTTSFLRAFGTALTTQISTLARTAIAGQAAAPNASLWERGVSAVRGVVGEAVGGVLDTVGSLMNTDWVQASIGRAVNTIGQLPLTDLYRFVIKQKNQIDELFDGIKDQLRALPFYREIAEFLQEQREALRGLLRPIIQAAVQFVGQMIQTAFSASEAAGTNIEAQIRSQIERNVRNPTARTQLTAATPEQQIAMLMNPNWCEQARISPADAERLRQMLQSPEYVRAGPSHSQVTKDHADSPFFGTTAALAAAAITDLRDKMIAVWESEGRNEQTDPDLQQNYASEIPPEIAARRAPPGTPESEMTADQRLAEREAVAAAPHYREISSREVGETLLTEGGLAEAEQAHGMSALRTVLTGNIQTLRRMATPLTGGLLRLAMRLETAAPDGAEELRAFAAEIPGNLENIADRLEQTTTLEELQQVSEQLRTFATARHGTVDRIQAALNRIAGNLENADPTFEQVAEEIRRTVERGSEFGEVLGRLVASIESGEPQQLRGEDQLTQLHNLAPVQTGSWSPELRQSHARPAPGEARMSPEREALFAYLRNEIFAHPYDSRWWRAPLVAWCNATQNRERIEAYIRARNSETLHVHH